MLCPNLSCLINGLNKYYLRDTTYCKFESRAIHDILTFSLINSSSALSFLLIEGAFDKAEEWTQLSASDRATIKSQYNAAGISLIVSLFGSTDAPTSTGADPIATANTMAAWVIQYGLDGVDVDYEVCLYFLIMYIHEVLFIHYSLRCVGLQCYQCGRRKS